MVVIQQEECAFDQCECTPHICVYMCMCVCICMYAFVYVWMVGLIINVNAPHS